MKTKTEKLINKMMLWADIYESYTLIKISRFEWSLKNLFEKWVIKKWENAFNKFWDETRYTPTIDDCIKILSFIPSSTIHVVYDHIYYYVLNTEKKFSIEECKIIIDFIDEQINYTTDTEKWWWLDQKEIWMELWKKSSKNFSEKNTVWKR